MSAILDRLPALATTGVGSLPFARPAEAARHALGAYAVPFCPQLPRLDGDMVSEWLGADPGRCGWTADRDRERPAAWDAFVEQLAAKPPDHGMVKLQVTGPVTLAIALERGAGRMGAGASVVSLARDVCVWLVANAAGQVSRLAEVGVDALVVVDEPGLAQAGVSAVETELWDPLRSVSSAWGLHVCGRVPWDLVGALELDVLSFDVAVSDLAAESRPVLEALLCRGGRIAWGVLDPVGPEQAGDASGRAAACVSATVRDGLPLERVAQLSLLTPSCGTGRLSPARERLVAATLDAAAQSTRDAVAAMAAKWGSDHKSAWGKTKR
ncbi:MAG: hypothetical protein H0T69_03715 [Thermoleophilaceae bacterium]|nr:hypothetical protein [Thermoleophilaceae bacterium]